MGEHLRPGFPRYLPAKMKGLCDLRRLMDRRSSVHKPRIKRYAPQGMEHFYLLDVPFLHIIYQVWSRGTLTSRMRPAVASELHPTSELRASSSISQRFSS